MYYKFDMLIFRKDTLITPFKDRILEISYNSVAKCWQAIFLGMWLIWKSKSK